MLVEEYVSQVAPTDVYRNDLMPALFGLYGEVGSVMEAAKKLKREGKAYPDFHQTAVEELGDALWYLAAIARRLDLDLGEIFFTASTRAGAGQLPALGARVDAPIVSFQKIMPRPDLDMILLDLGRSASAILNLIDASHRAREMLIEFASIFIEVVAACNASFQEVALQNVRKTRGRFLEVDINSLPRFDVEFADDERIPEEFEIEIGRRSCGKVCMRWNGVFIGDPLTDNIEEEDGYRYHDVFHFSHAAILHWSPTFRSLIKHKRKSRPSVDEQQDGGRAIVVEEGLTAWIFSRAKSMDFFAGMPGISFDLLKSVHHFVRGYEVQECPLKLWEEAILKGYEVFREVRRHEGGVVKCSKKDRSIRYFGRKVTT